MRRDLGTKDFKPPPRTRADGSALASNSLGRSPSPKQIRGRAEELAAQAEIHQRSIITISQQCTEDLETKSREKAALTKLLNELKKKKLQYDARIGKKKRDMDNAIVQTMDLEKKLTLLNNSNRMMTSELQGLRKENEKLEVEVETFRRDLQGALQAFEKECLEVDKVKRMVHSYRKEINAEGKQRENVQQDLRASRTAQNLMIDRLDDMEKRNRALRTCVSEAFNS